MIDTVTRRPRSTYFFRLFDFYDVEINEKTTLGFMELYRRSW